MKKHLLWLLALIWSATALGETITVARALEICSGLASGVSTTESYTIEGYVNSIASNDFNSTYNNMRFWIADTKGSASSNANGALLVYRGRPDVELQVGDKISVTSVLKNYNGTYETGTTNCPVTLLHRQTVLTERDTTFGSLRICAQNLENYYINYNTGRGNYSQDEINAKTNKIVNMMLTINADIYAFCEVEAKPAVLTYLANAANSAYGANVFVAVSDGIDEDWDATYNNNIKSGFIYRSDRVAPVGSNNAIYSANYYCNTMRYQAFQQLSNGEKLVVSMNHFKAKDSSSDQGESTRLTNANRLVNTLSTVTTDPDILILGDLNCQYGEAPITYIMNAGYAEQILRFDSTNYSHCYGGGELIDHVIANSSMEQQIVDAYVRHLSTTCSTGVTSDMSYSDHDPYVVEINLSSSTTPSSITTCAAAAQAALSVSANNELYNNGATYTIRGYVTAIQTAYNSSYGNITFWMADTQNGGKVLEAYRCSADASAVPNVGDYVEVTGNLTKYGSTPEFASGCSCQVIYTSAPPVNLGAKTIYEFLQLKNVKDTCVLTGIVENIVMDGEDTSQYNKFGNFYINDGTGSLYIYGLLTADGQTQQFRTMGIDEGDTLTLKAVYAEYNSNPQAANAIYVSHSKFVSTNWGPVTVKLDPTSVETYNWGNVGIWAWVTNGTNSTDLFASWPGVQVTKDITGWWSYTFENIPEGQLNIIWNDFGSYGYQTSDISNITSNTCFKLTGKSYYQVVTCQDTLHLANVANYIDFQALSAAYPAMTATTITSTNTYTLPNGSVLRGWLNPETSAEASNTWNVKENYNTVMPTPEMNGVEALRAGTMFRAASHTSISLGAFNMPSDGKLTVYFQPNGDSNRGVSITVGDNTYDFMKSGVKIDGTRPAYAAEVDLPAGYYMKGSVVITALTNTINIFGVRISPEPEVVLSNDLTVAEAITLGNQLGDNTLSEDSVSVIGYVVSAQPFDMAFGNQSFYIADDPNGEQTMQAYRAIPMKDGALYPVLVGDLVRIKGKLQHYVNANTSEDFVELYQPSVSFLTEVDGDRSLPAVPVINVTQALQRGNELSVGYRTSTVYDIVGYVTNIVEDAVSTYGNMTFWISDTQNGAASNAEGGFYVYRGATGKSLQVGDQVRVRTYIRNTSVLIDNSNVIASAASVPVTFLCQSMSNVNISKVWPIILDNTTYSAWNDKIQYDFRQNDENCFFYIWDNTYSSISSGSGLNFYGNYDGYWRFVVGTQDWAGGGLYLGNNPALTAEALRQAIVAHPEKYYLHMAVKATDNYTHAFYVFNNEGAAFELGDHSAYGHEVRQNFTRNGEWQEIYVPLSDYVNAFAATDMSNNPNLFVILSEAVQGAQIDLDAVFICEIGEGTPQPAGTPTAEDLVAAGYNTTNNIVMAFKFDDAPCYDVVITGTYASWSSDPTQLVHMLPLTGFDGWYAAQIPYNGDNDQAKPIQLSDVGAFNWDFQAGDSWIHRGGVYADIEYGYNNEVNVYYGLPGAYIYEIEYWKNHNSPCTSLTTTYDVYLNAPANAPESVEMIGSFDGWTGTPMTYNSQLGMWYVRIQAVPTDEFKFRTGIGADDNTKWNNQIQSYDAENDTWSDLPNLLISQHLSSENVVYVDYSNGNLYRWTLQPEQPGEPIELTIDSITSEFYTEDNDIWYKLYLADEKNHFAIDIIVPEGMRDVELGQVYTWDNMLQEYCYGRYNSYDVYYSEVQFLKTQTAGGVNITALITATSGQQYMLTYTGADATPFDYDATYAFAENFSGYTDYANNTNQRGVVAQNDNNGYIDLVFNVPEGCDSLAVGTYTINATGNPMTVKASEGFVSGITTSWAGYYDGNGSLEIPVWYLVSGTVTVAADGTINVNALNSKGYAIQCQLSKPQVTTYQVYLSAPANAPESVEIIGSFSGWSTGVQMTYNTDLGMWYATIQAAATDEFKFRQVGTWSNQIQVYDADNEWWSDCSDLIISEHLSGSNIVYVDYSNSSLYRWTVQPEQPGNWFIDWNNLPAGYVFEAVCPQDASLIGLKSVKVYADTTYIHILVEPDLNELPDLSFVPFHIYLNTDNSNATGGSGYPFIDANTDILLEGAVFAEGEFSEYNPLVYKWWGEVGGTDWNWSDPNIYPSADNCWGAIVCEGALQGLTSQYINGKIEMRLTRKMIPATWNKTQFGIGFDIQQNWDPVGVLPIGSPTDENPNGKADKMTITMYGASEPVEPTSTYYVYLNAPEHAPSAIEVIGSFDGWTGTAMTTDGSGLWYATIQATPSTQFKFREAGNWNNEIQFYDAANGWYNPDNLVLRDYLIDTINNFVYANFSDTTLYRWRVRPVPITPDPIELTINSITSEFYNADNDIWYKLYLADEENYFAIDIIVPEGMRDVELGQLYTWTNMLQHYCYGQYNGARVNYADAQFVKTQTAGGVIISALVTAENGQQYMLTYTGADATPFDYDATYAFAENFTGYSNNVYSTNQRRVYAQNDNNGYIDLVFNVPEGCDSLAVGTYLIDNTGNPMTVKASEGFAGGAMSSFAVYVSTDGSVYRPYWYMVSGTVTVAADGTITVNALNSKGFAVQSQLTKAQPTIAPTESDLENAGYDTDNNIVLAYKFDVAPCYDVVVAGNYATTATGGWVEDPAVLIHMEPLTGFDGWYAAQFPYFDGAQAKPVQLSSEGAFSWNYQAGNSWIYRGGNDATIESGYDGEVNVYYESAGAYIYEIKYWKNGNNPCEELVNTINVYFKAPANAPDSIEIIGSFGNGWSAGTLMTYDLANDWWYAQIQATPSDEFKFRQAGTWDNEIQVYNAENAEWLTCGNLSVSNYLSNGVMFIDFSGSDFRWSAQATDTRYIPYNLQAVSVPGRVEFSWDVDVVSDQYKLHIYDVNSTAAYYLTIYGTSTYVYAVEDFLDGMEFRWSIEPIAPYDLDEVFADSTILMQKSAVELSGFNLTTVDSITLDLTWQTNTESLLYRVEVDYNGYIIREETVNLKEYHFTSQLPGWHQVYVQPLNANGEAVGRYAYAGEINLARVPEPFSNLQGAANEHELTFTWNKVVDSVYVQIFRMVDGEFSDYIYHAPTAGNSMVYTVNEDGNYALQLRAYLEVRPGEYETVSYAKYITVQAFSVPTYSIQIDAAEGGYIWPDLSGEYPLGYTLKATAQPYDGYRFIGWSDGNTEQERTITVQGAMSITALFEALDSYTVTVQASEGGQVYVSYLGDYTTLYSETLYEGTYIQLQARPVDGYAFYQWSDGVTDAIRYITVNADVNLTAIFMPYRHLTVAVNDASMGKVTVTGNYDFADGVYTAAHGAALTLIAQPNEGYHFVGWSDGVQTVQRIVNLTEDKSLTAIFAVNTAPVVQYTITVSATDGGSVNDVSGTYNAGDMIELIATPMEGYEFVRWSDGVTTNPRPMTVSENKQLTAIFQIRTFTVTILAGQGGTVSGQVSGTFDYGTDISFAAKANEHYRFTAWSDGVTDASRSIRLVQDTALVATFAAIPSYTLSLTAGQGGQIRVGNEAYATSFNRAYDENTPVVIEAKADADYAFLRWSDGNTNAIRVITMNKNQTLTAEFQQLVKLTIFTSGNGTVEVQGDATASGNVYSAVSGTILTLTAKPAEGYRFTGWSDNVQAITRVITLTETKLLVANFEQATTTTQYNVSVGISGTGTGTVNGKTSLQGQYYDGDQIELTAVAGALSEFAGWSDGVTTNPRTIVVSQDTTITAIFNIVPVVEQYTIVFKNYDGTVLDSAKWNAGETPVCPVTPTRPADEDNTYTFSGWSPAIVPAAADAVYTATYEATPVTPPTFTVTFYDWDDTVLDTQTVVKGGNATPPADPTREGYVFKGWDGNYTNVQHNEAVWATYEPAKEGFEDVVGDAAPQKVMINGVIYILRGGKTYTINGQEIKE